MKKKISLLLCAAMALSLLAACGPKTPAEGSSSSGSASASQSSGSASTGDSSSNAIYAPARLMVLSGPTGIGAAKLISDGDTDLVQSYEVVADNTEVTTALVNGDVDIAAIATNAAANLYAKTDGGIQVLAVNTLGVLYILEKGDTVHSMADLAGKTLYAPSNTKGANPEHILNHLLESSGVSPADVDIQWITPQEITAQMTTSDAGICMLPVPAATALLIQDSGVRQALSLSEEWDSLGEGALPMGCIVARTEYIEKAPQYVEAFLAAYEESIDYMVDEANREDAAQLVADLGIAPNAKVAAAAIPQSSLTFLTGQEMKDALEGYYTVLFQAAPDSIGGGLPYDSFYYGLG